MIKFIKSWALPIAMFIGSVGHGFFKDYAFISPYFIFLMLLLTFCKISFSDLKLRPVHFLLLAFQLGGSVAAYYLLLPFHELVAQSVLLCIVCPTATAAAVITMRLGGDAASLTTYTLLSNLGTALLVPAFFPLVETTEIWTNNAEIVEKGNYVAVIVSEDKDAIVEAFNGLFA